MLDSILMWFRRDLRDTDNVALAEATRRGRRVFCVFVFDRDILDHLPTRTDRRVEFIHASVLELDAALRRQGGALIVRHKAASEVIPRLAAELGVDAVFTSRDYEPSAKARDAAVAQALESEGICFEAFKDQAVLDGAEVLARTGQPLTIFTPYRNAWLKRLDEADYAPHDIVPGRLALPPVEARVPTLADLGFHPTDLAQTGVSPGMGGAERCFEGFRARISGYADDRDFPARAGGSVLSPHLRFGTISVRRLVYFSISAGALRENAGAATWLSELAWRDFFFMILDRFPHVVGHSFRPAFDAVRWETGEAADRAFAAWCAGQTGYPLVDAAMRQLNQTGLMHNRVRMVVASFLTKDLGIDWRRGEAYFADLLLDFDLSANNGNWQWAASTGCDAQPYFRIFNPVTQSERFDPDGSFIRAFVPELANVPTRDIHAPWRMGGIEQAACGVRLGEDYPAPCVDHDAARRAALARYAAIKPAATS